MTNWFGSRRFMIFSNSSNHLLPNSYEYAGFEHHLNRRSIKKNDLTKNIKNIKLKDSVLQNIMRNTSNHTPQMQNTTIHEIISVNLFDGDSCPSLGSEESQNLNESGIWLDGTDVPHD